MWFISLAPPLVLVWSQVKLVDCGGENRVAKVFNSSRANNHRRMLDREHRIMRALSDSPRITRVYHLERARQDGKVG